MGAGVDEGRRFLPCNELEGASQFDARFHTGGGSFAQEAAGIRGGTAFAMLFFSLWLSTLFEFTDGSAPVSCFKMPLLALPFLFEGRSND